MIEGRCVCDWPEHSQPPVLFLQLRKSIYSGEIFTFPPLVTFQKLVSDFIPLPSLR